MTDEKSMYGELDTSERAIVERKKLLEFTPEDEKILKELQPLIEKNAPGIIDDFYGHVLKLDFSKAFLSDPDVVKRLKEFWKDYLAQIFSGDYDKDYFGRRLAIGQTHSKKGLVPRWYIGAYGFLTNLLFRYIAAEFEDKPERLLPALNALNKALNMDMQLAIDAYDESHHRAMEEAHRKLEDYSKNLEEKVEERTKELRKEEARIRAILETAPNGIITIDEQRTIVSVNPMVETLFGYSKDELIGQNIKMLMPEPYHSNHDGYVGNYLNTGKKKVIGIGREVKGMHKDGTTFPLYLSVGEAIVGDERFFTGILHDMTELKKAEEAVKKYAEELEERLKLLEGKGVSRYDLLIKQKNSYLIKEIRFERSLVVFSDLMKFGSTGLCLTVKHPDVLRETYGIKDFKCECIWLSTSGEKDAIDHSNLTAIHGKVSEFTKNNENSVVLFMGLEYIITVNRFEKSLKFLNSIINAMVTNNSRLIITLDPETLEPRELSLLEKSLIEIKDGDLIRLGLK